MKAERTYLDYLEDILDAMQKIRGFIQGMDYEQFSQDSKTGYAVVHGLEIIGEASKRVPDSVKHDHPEIPWRTMAGMRDKLIHNYFGTNPVVIWRTVSEDLPAIDPLVRRIVEDSERAE
jgi:uncharacterized protein with HEPN domain